MSSGPNPPYAKKDDVKFDDATWCMRLMFLSARPAHIVNCIEQFFTDIFIIRGCRMATNICTGAYQGFLNYKKSIENKESEEAISKAFKDMQDGIRKYESSFDITGPLFEGKGVCQAYAVTFQALAQEAGLETMYVSGNTDDFDPHAWNYAKVDGQWLALDVTWNDSDGDSNKTENEYLLLAMDNPLYAQSHYAFDRYEDAIKE